MQVESTPGPKASPCHLVFLAYAVSCTRRWDVSIILYSHLFPFNPMSSIFFAHGFLLWPRPCFPLKSFVESLLHPRAYWLPLLVLSGKKSSFGPCTWRSLSWLCWILGSPSKAVLRCALSSGIPSFSPAGLRVFFLFCRLPDMTVINLLPARPQLPPHCLLRGKGARGAAGTVGGGWVSGGLGWHNSKAFSQGPPSRGLCLSPGVVVLPYIYCSCISFLKNIYLFTDLFIWPHQVLAVACELFVVRVGSRSPTGDQIQGPLHWEYRVLATRPPGKSHLSCLL